MMIYPKQSVRMKKLGVKFTLEPTEMGSIIVAVYLSSAAQCDLSLSRLLPASVLAGYPWKLILYSGFRLTFKIKSHRGNHCM